jgi:intergrase/recombinase
MSRLLDGNYHDWQQFHQYLLQRMNDKTAEDRIRYTKQFARVLQTHDATILLQVTPNKRIHVMKALSSLARYTGQQDIWKAIRQRYGLQWSTGTEKLDAFTRFFDSSKDLDIMIGWLKEAMQVLPTNYANFFLFCTLTGMRCSEALASVKLIKNSDTFMRYYDPDRCLLRHYAFSDLFIRRTKAVYISIADKKIVGIVQNIDKVPAYDGLKMVSRRRSLNMKIKYCRKIYASWLHKSGISSDLIDMLQGRVGKNIFLKPYLTPSADYKDRVLQALEKL